MAGTDSTYQGPPPGLTTLRDNDKKENDNSDFQHYLKQLSDRASRFAINLDDQVDRDTTTYFTGGDAIVYRGKLRPEGTLVAVKTFRFGHRSDSTVLKTMLREAHVWSKLAHPNVLPLLGIATKFDNTVSIISKWMSNGNAHDYVQDLKVDPRPLLRGVARGLDYLHNCSPNPVYHGDLKGFNILISDGGHALLTDFGLSYLVNSSFSMTGQQQCGGSLNWMAPEFLATEGNVEMTPAGDVWSFGMTVLELFTRKKPFHETGHHIRILFRILNGPLPDRPSHGCTWSRMSDEWWDLCCLCWNTTASLRPPMSQIVEMIEGCWVSK
ncbi:hypothetical protein M404DRAFT_818389 [Pisolithus tinctorius Marx 270]|uniref:Protein kinase domain-containing protein n=1 Tax=Pisolithus tinctorius Marx 270 TaxID=870435 RepID=A0A0C3NVD5_PISTI|nr:hypothetical protein M404DRAFT_818389 [Pisolithus tinctorius Marx 270]